MPSLVSKSFPTFDKNSTTPNVSRFFFSSFSSSSGDDVNDDASSSSSSEEEEFATNSSPFFFPKSKGEVDFNGDDETLSDILLFNKIDQYSGKRRFNQKSCSLGFHAGKARGILSLSFLLKDVFDV
tara:strand:- start:2844 stop:3221 length:378 start_codon:yes stop_codon:yes gene_type:complete